MSSLLEMSLLIKSRFFVRHYVTRTKLKKLMNNDISLSEFKLLPSAFEKFVKGNHTKRYDYDNVIKFLKSHSSLPSSYMYLFNLLENDELKRLPNDEINKYIITKLFGFNDHDINFSLSEILIWHYDVFLKGRLDQQIVELPDSKFNKFIRQYNLLSKKINIKDLILPANDFNKFFNTIFPELSLSRIYENGNFHKGLIQQGSFYNFKYHPTVSLSKGIIVNVVKSRHENDKKVTIPNEAYVRINYDPFVEDSGTLTVSHTIESDS